MLTGNSGGNVPIGRSGNDVYHIGAGDTVMEAAGEGTDIVYTGITHTLAANVENLRLTGSGAVNGTGNGLNNVITGNSGANVLTGHGGSDSYYIGARHHPYACTKR